MPGLSRRRTILAGIVVTASAVLAQDAEGYTRTAMCAKKIGVLS
jgi:hypothetical protein